jgi:DNA-binding NtrC family response regulator
VPVPAWVKKRIDEWTQASGTASGCLFRSINKTGSVWGNGVTEKVVWYERSLLVRAIEKTNGNQTQAARLLRVTRDTLRYKMKKFQSAVRRGGPAANCLPVWPVHRSGR